MQSCIKPWSADLPPAPPTFNARLNNGVWKANSTISAIIQQDTASGCAFLTITGLKVIDANDPLAFEQIAFTVNNLNGFTTTDLCIPVGNYFENNNAANPTTGCTGGGNNGRIYSSAIYTNGANILSNGTNICTVKITACKDNAISGTFAFKAIDNLVVPAKTYNITGGSFTDVPIVLLP